MNSSREEAERLLGLSDNLLQKGDLKGSRELAVIAQETEPLLEASDQLLAIIDVLEAAEKPPNTTTTNNNNNNHNLDWYAILQVDRCSQDLNLIKQQYRRLALLLHPDKNPFSFALHAFKLVSDAWAVLSDPAHKPIYDMGFDHGPSSFWTACPYCYLLYEYPRVYEGCCLMCQNCDRSFHGLSIPSLPPIVPGQEAYYCSWGCFPMGFVFENLESGGEIEEPAAVVAVPNGVASASKKRGRPRKVV